MNIENVRRLVWVYVVGIAFLAGMWGRLIAAEDGGAANMAVTNVAPDKIVSIPNPSFEEAFNPQEFCKSAWALDDSSEREGQMVG